MMVTGKIKAIIRTPASTKENLFFDYDAQGNRIAKHVYTSANVWKHSTYYLRDAQGNVMSVYDKKPVLPSSMSYKLTEQHLYGSSRIGMVSPNFEMIGAIAIPDTTKSYLGLKQYELSNHLGNVITVISDKKIQIASATIPTMVDHYISDQISASDYYPFGSVAKGRSFSSSAYRYGFNGQEKDNEVSGEGNDYDFGNRIYDSRLGRWLSLDPLQKKYPGISPYCYSNDNPISFADPDGRDPRVAIIIETHPEKNEFNDHVKGLEAAGYTVIKVKTGEELLNALKTNSSKDSPIKDLVIISHASNSGFFGEGGKDNGFYSPSGLEETASTTKTMEYLSKPEATSDMAKAIEFVESKEFKTNVVDPYQIEMRGKGARTTDDLKKMIDNGEINLDEKAKEIVLGGCNTVSVGKENKAYPTIATSIATATNKEVIGSSKSTSPVHHTTQRNGKWNKVSADGTKATPIGGGTKLDLTTKKVTP